MSVRLPGKMALDDLRVGYFLSPVCVCVCDATTGHEASTRRSITGDLGSRISSDLGSRLEIPGIFGPTFGDAIV